MLPMVNDELVKSADAFDPRHLASLAAGGQEPVWMPEAFVAASHTLLPMYYGMDAECLAAVRDHLQEHRERRAMFGRVREWPDASAPLSIVIHWWQHRQPSALLKKVALNLWTSVASQGAAERAWAIANRIKSPFRNRLSIETQQEIQQIAMNIPLLIDDLKVKPNPCLSRCMAYDSLPSVNLAKITRREGLQGQDIWPEDDAMSLISSSSSSSSSSTDGD